MRRLWLMLLALFPGAMAAQTPPELPRATPSVVAPTITGVVHKIGVSADVQAAINSAAAGDALEFPCSNQTYTGNLQVTKALILRIACWASLPSGRMTPAAAGTLKLPKFATSNNMPAITIEGPVHDVALIGLEVIGAPTGTTALIALGSDQQTSLLKVPQRLLLDHLYMHGTPTTTVRRCVALNSGATTIVNSHCDEVHEPGADAQAIMGWTGPGPYLIRNNYLSAASEIIMFGGGDPRISGLRPSDITIDHNTLTRPPSWYGSQWLIKNLFELKNASRVLVEGNVMENNWMWGQDGTAIVMKSTNQDNTCPWCGTTDVMFRWNIVRNIGGGFNIAAHPEIYPVVPLARVVISDNLITGIWAPGFPGAGVAFMVQQDIADLVITRNTVVSDSAVGSVVFLPEGAHMTRFRFTDNIMAAAPNYGIYGQNTGAGSVAIDLYAPGAVVTGNLFTGMVDRYNIDDYQTMYPPGNSFLRSTADVGFLPDFSRASKDSVGVNINKLQIVQAGFSSPTGATMSVAQVRSALTALKKATGPTGRENTATKDALLPLVPYLERILAAIP